MTDLDLPIEATTDRVIVPTAPLTPLQRATQQYQRSQWPFWTFVLTLIVGLLYLFSPILMPFVVGAIIAYFMDPFVDLLEKRRVPRWAGTVIALVLFTLLIAALITLLVPMIKTQIEALLTAAPGYAATVKSSFLPWAERYLRQIDPDAVGKLQDAAGDSAGDIVGGLANGLKAVLSKGFALFDLLALLIVTPIVAFYLLRDWDAIIAHIDRCLPRRHAAIIRAEASKIDRSLSGFLHGQALVCLSLGTYYAITLSLVGLDYGATIGVIVGVLTFVPYVGGILGFICSAGLALIQFDNPTQVLVVVGIYILGQTLEGNVVSPKLVGDRIGLHPVWIIFAVMAGGSLFGFVGVLVALPVAAILGVLIRFGLDQYAHSHYYLTRTDRRMAQQLPLGLGWREDATGADAFVVADSNAEAVAYLDCWPDWPANPTAPALLLLGPPASGKTHLARVWQARAGASLINDGQGLDAGQGATVLDDCETWAASAEEPLFHLLNRARENRFTLLLCAAMPPEGWGLTLPDLRSRLKALPVAQLREPDDTLLAALFVRALTMRGLQIKPELLDYALPRLPRSAAAIAPLAAALDAQALAGGKGLTLSVVREFFRVLGAT